MAHCIVFHEAIVHFVFFCKLCAEATEYRYVSLNNMRNALLGDFHCANIIECTYTNVDSVTYYTPRLYGITYCS